MLHAMFDDTEVPDFRGRSFPPIAAKVAGVSNNCRGVEVAMI